MRVLVKNIKELVGVESTPQPRKQGKEMAQIETVKEAYLIQEGYLMRLPRGREATMLAYQHLDKLKQNGNQQELF